MLTSTQASLCPSRAKSHSKNCRRKLLSRQMRSSPQAGDRPKCLGGHAIAQEAHRAVQLDQVLPVRRFAGSRPEHGYIVRRGGKCAPAHHRFRPSACKTAWPGCASAQNQRIGSGWLQLRHGQLDCFSQATHSSKGIHSRLLEDGLESSESEKSRAVVVLSKSAAACQRSSFSPDGASVGS